MPFCFHCGRSFYNNNGRVQISDAICDECYANLDYVSDIETVIRLQEYEEYEKVLTKSSEDAAKVLDFIKTVFENNGGIMSTENVCENCGMEGDCVIVNEGFSDEITLCPSCIEEMKRNDEIIVCEDCGAIVLVEDATNVKDLDRWVCNSCLTHSHKYSLCEGCGEYFSESEMTYIGGGDYVCSDCLEERYRQCEECGEYHEVDEMTYMACGSNGEGWYCEECSEHTSCLIGEYHDSREQGFTLVASTRDSATKKLYLGIELEKHCPDMSRTNACAAKFDNLHGFYRHFQMENDCSLRNGFEAVSHPHTLNAWEEARELLAEMFRIYREHEFYEDSRAGMHIHVTRAGMTTPHIVRLYTFVNEAEPWLSKIGGRSYEGHRHCSKWTTDPDSVLHTVKERHTDRYQAVNLNNERTVELRFFGSPENVDKLFSRIECAHALYRFTKENPITCAYQNCRKNIDSVWNAFASFVKDRGEIYTDLLEEMIALELF